MGMKLSSYILIFCASLVFGSCNRSAKDAESIKVKNITPGISKVFKGGINYSAKELVISNHLKKSLNASSTHQLDSLDQEMSTERVFQVEFQHLSEADLLQSKYTNLDYSESVQYMSSYIGADFFIVTNNQDTLVSQGVIFERNFKIAPFKRVLVFFTSVDPTAKVDLVYNDRLFGNGQIKFNHKDLKL